MTGLLAALDPSLVENSALGMTAVAVVLGLVLLKILTSVIGRAISTVVMLAIALGSWSQRAAISDCVDTVKAQAAAGTITEATCSFFGRDITLKVPLPGN